MERHPNAWLFFIPFIIFTTFMVLNLFIGIIVNAIQEEHAAAEAAEREVERQAERNMLHAETVPVMRAIDDLKGEMLALREVVAAMGGPRERKAAMSDEREESRSEKR